jgi:hypothetical protein
LDLLWCEFCVRALINARKLSEVRATRQGRELESLS